VAQLRAHHHTSQTTEGPEAEAKRFSGLDLINGVVRDNLAAGVVEPAISKIKSLRCDAEPLSKPLSKPPSKPLSSHLQDQVPPVRVPPRSVAWASQSPLSVREPLLLPSSDPPLTCDLISPLKRFATEAAISILRIDDHIKLNVHKQNQGR
jgi:hypothetical protein